MNLATIRNKFCVEHNYPINGGCVVIVNGVARCWAPEIGALKNVHQDLSEGDRAFVVNHEYKIYSSVNGAWVFDGMQTTKYGLPSDLRRLAFEMQIIGEDMKYAGGFSEIAQHGVELCGAASIALGWANGIEGEE